MNSVVQAPLENFALLDRAPAAVDQLVQRIERETGRPLKSGSLEAGMRALAHACRGELLERLHETLHADRQRGARRVHYLSMEFLMGRALANALAALDLRAAFETIAERAGCQPSDILEREHDAALGNGGLGRLAACFLDSMATLELPAFGYGLRYEYGIFAQLICDGQQIEEPDDWLRDGNPWEIKRSELRYRVGFGGHVLADSTGRRWVPAESLDAIPYDFIVPGQSTRRVSLLRQWQAIASRPIDLAAFSRGDYAAAGAPRQSAEPITWVLYPDDSTAAGRELRLRQEFFLVSATLQDIIARHLEEHGRLDDFGEKAAVHLNDTHPALAVPELLRLLIDEHGMSWDAAAVQCQRATSYTNHTLMPEALETWPVRMFEQLLPRHLEIIYEVNERFLSYVRSHFHDERLVSRVSLIDEHGERHIKMAALSIVSSHRVNGVSKLHSDLMVRTIFADYAHILPNRFCNVTNGVTPRRWLAQANPPLAQLLDRRLGRSEPRAGEPRDWRIALERLGELEPLAGDAGFRAEILAAKRANKDRLAALIGRELGLAVDPDSMFDVQIKRIHEYKRQLLNVLQVIARYQLIVDSPNARVAPRTVIFAGKAASAYIAAKQIIRLIHDVARTVNGDPRVKDRLKIVFLPNYGVSLAETLIPAADLSEQISTAGTEASGTGNMKFALNGALTMATWDGATIEMAEAIGREHFFIFGLSAEQALKLRALGYDPRLHYEENSTLKHVLDAIGHGRFSPGEPDRYRSLVDGLLTRDPYLLLADFSSYLAAQARADEVFGNRNEWADKAIRNIAGMGAFSSDRAIGEYARNIWGIC